MNISTTAKLNQMVNKVHKANRKWWLDLKTGKPFTRNRGELIMLVITELAEAVEGLRKNLMDDKLPKRKMEEVEMADAVIRLLDYAGGFNLKLVTPSEPTMYKAVMACRFKDIQNKAEQILFLCGQVTMVYYKQGTAAERLHASGAIYLIAAYCEFHGLDLSGAVDEKLAFNAKREDHTTEARKRANGKKF